MKIHMSKWTAALILLTGSLSWGQTVPPMMNYQGTLRDANGDPVADGEYELSFRIFAAESGGSEVWGPHQFNGQMGDGKSSKVPVINGQFNVFLGPKDTLSRDLADAFNGNLRYLEIEVDNASPIVPRQQILSTPYAYKAKAATEADHAGSADQLQDKVTIVGGGATVSVNADLNVSGNYNAPKLNNSVTLTPGSGTYQKMQIVAGSYGGNKSVAFRPRTAASGASQYFHIANKTSSIIVSGLGAGFQNSGTTTHHLKVDGNIICGNGSIACSSDKRWKQNIQPIESALEKVERLQGVHYEWNRTAYPEKGFLEGTQLGLIAQEVEDVVPEVVSSDDAGYRMVAYSSLVPLLIEAIKEQQEQIQRLESQMNSAGLTP